ncbi:MAG: c-type cytochrome biogenesis protein CcmI [Stenotrophobium sp.]
MIFLLMGLLAVLAMVLLTRPWWWRGRGNRVERRSANVAAYRTRLTEISGDIKGGILNETDAEDLRQESAARLLADVQPPSAPASRQIGWLLAITLSVALPALAALWYWQSESWRLQRDIELVAAHPEQAQTVMIESMVQRLERRLKKTPDDAEGWAMLGRSYFVTQRYADAAAAYRHANDLNGGQSAESLVGEGEALAMAHDRDLTGRPAQLFDAALKLDPDNAMALWYAGLAAAQSGAYATAQADWLKLRAQALPPEMAQALEARLKELSSLSGLPLPPISTASAAAGVSLHVEVSLDPALVRQLPSDATLFVFAKAAAGPPMPLAVKKFLPGQWSLKAPLEIDLDDSMAMMPQLRLSLFQKWLVMARISRQGLVQAEAGDLQGQIVVDRADAKNTVRLTIGTVVGTSAR